METIQPSKELKAPRSTGNRRVICLIPARHEPQIGATVESVIDQNHRPDLTVIIINNNKDGGITERAATEVAEKYRHLGVVVWHSQSDGHAKAGALNQALAVLLPQLDPNDAVIVMDADTTLGSDFVDQGLSHLTDGVGGVGAIFVGRQTSSLIGILQRMEYHRYGVEIARLGHRTPVLTGTGTMFSVSALTAVKDARQSGKLPYGESYYDTRSLTEDNEMTLALRTLGYEALAPGTTSTTDVMETWRTLMAQRTRWFLGALNNLRNYGTKLPWHLKWTYWRQQLGLSIAAIMMIVYVLAILTATIFLEGVEFAPIWLIPTGIALIERVKSVWDMGTKFRLIAASVVIEQLYTMFLLFIFLKAAFMWLIKGKGCWGNT